jgi:DNA-binding NtrC family response regulator
VKSEEGMGSKSPCAPRKKAGVLLVYPDRTNCRSLDDILSHSKCHLHHVHNCREALSFLNKHAAAVMISDADLSDGTWRDLLHETSRLANAPNLIVTSRLADERLWADVLNEGGYDLLLTPFDSNEVTRILTQAWQDWRKKKNALLQKADGKAANSSDKEMVEEESADGLHSNSWQKETA